MTRDMPWLLTTGHGFDIVWGCVTALLAGGAWLLARGLR